MQAKQGPANLGMCAPAALKMTVPFSNAVKTSENVMRASSKESPRGLETEVTCKRWKIQTRKEEQAYG